MGDPQKGKNISKKHMGQQYKISQKPDRAKKNSDSCAVIALAAAAGVVSAIGGLAAAGANPFI